MRTKFSILTITISTIIYFSCQKELSFDNNNKEQFINAKAWFDKYLANNQINPMFKNIDYYWQNATIFKFSNGYKVITVPLMEKNQNPAYRGRRMLYLYPWKNGKGFYTQIFELIPDRSHLLKNRGNINLKTYSGLISSYDLKKGFNIGSKFDNGIVEKNIFFTKQLPQNANQNFYPISSQISSVANSDLPGVTVVGYIPGPSAGTWYLLLTKYGDITLTMPWGGGGGNNSGYNEYTPPPESTDPGAYFNQDELNHIMQKMQDMQWKEESVKDSTNNPCVGSVLSELTALTTNLNVPALIRSFFGSDANFSMTIKMENLGYDKGGEVDQNTLTSDFSVKINSNFNDATDLSIASTIIHEALHCQLESWFREAIANHDTARQIQLANDYGYTFGNSNSPIALDCDLVDIVNGGNLTEHQNMATQYIDNVSLALHEFAIDKGINVNLDYCKDLAWSGLTSTKAFTDLSQANQDRIRDRVAAEKDPNGTNQVNLNYTDSKGHPCN